MNEISSVYPVSKENALELTKSLKNALDKFNNYEDLSMMMKRYKDILVNKTPNMITETDASVEKSDKKFNGEKKKKKSKETKRNVLIE